MKLWLAILSLFLVSATFGQSSNKLKYFTLKDPSADSGSVCVLRDIHFKFYHSIDSASFPVVDSIVDFLKRNPTIKMEIQAFMPPTTGQMCFIPKLAGSVADYLIQHGIDASRIVSYEMGSHWAIIPQSEIDKMKTPEEKKAANEINKRVVLKIIGIIKK